METTMQVMFWDVLRMVLISAASVYVVLIASAYVKSGSRFALELDDRDLLGSVAAVLLWLGVKAAGGVAGLSRALADFFSEPSAEVGEWLIGRSPRLHRGVVPPRRH